MTLAKFLQVENMKPSHFAARLGVSVSTITRILSGDRGPGWKLARRIAEITDNRVTRNDFAPKSALSQHDGEAA